MIVSTSEPDNMQRRRLHRCCLVFCRAVLVLHFIASLSEASLIRESTIDEAVAYLLSQQNVQGYWSDGHRQAVDTIEVVTALQPLRNRPDIQGAVDKALAFVRALDQTNNDMLTRKLCLLAEATDDMSFARAVLLAVQNEDGGWGLSAGKQSDVLDTILAAEALLHEGSVGSIDALCAARDFVVTAKDPNSGCWTFGSERTPSDVSRTAMILIALRDIEMAGLHSFAAAKAALEARNFLESQAVPSDANLSCAEVALTYRALLRMRQPYDVNEYCQRLLRSQASDGSWEHDVFTTAAVLQALSMV